MQATVRLREYLRYNKLTKGQTFTFVHWDTEFPVKVTFVRMCKNPNKIRVERLYGQSEQFFWTVDIDCCHVPINV